MLQLVGRVFLVALIIVRVPHVQPMQRLMGVALWGRGLLSVFSARQAQPHAA